MENFFKKLTNKLSSEYVVELVEDGKVLDDEFLKEEADEVNAKTYMDVDATPKLKNSGRKLNEIDEKITEKDSKDLEEKGSVNSKLNVENANVQEEHSKPHHNRDFTFFF